MTTGTTTSTRCRRRVRRSLRKLDLRRLDDDKELGRRRCYNGITSTELVAIVNNGALYKASDPVTKPMDLYPIYIDYSVNILTEIEGYSADADKTVRSSVGSTHVEKVTNTDGITSYRVFVKDATGNDLSVDGALPDGYRFLGWYKNVDA